MKSKVKQQGTQPTAETRVLNLYAGIGGNRKLWANCKVTAVENVQFIADAYKEMYPSDTVIVADAHEYLLKHFQEFDLIWASPPCPTHSRLRTGLAGWGLYVYPDMTLYQEILFLKHFYKGKYVIENVIPYYNVLIQPTMVLDRHFFWSNFYIPPIDKVRDYTGEISNATVEQLTKGLGITLPPNTKDKRKLLRNAVDPRIGLHVLNASQRVSGQLELDLLKGDDVLEIAP